MKYKDLPKCPVETTIRMMNCKWKILIIRDLLSGTKRFGELKNLFPVLRKKFLLQNCEHWKKMV